MIGRHSCAMKFVTEMCCDLCCKTYKCADNVRAGLNLKEIHKQKLKGVLHLGVAGAGPFGCEKTGCVISGVRKFEILFYSWQLSLRL